MAESIAIDSAKRKAEDAVEWVSDPYSTDDDGNDDGNTHCEVQFIESI